LNLSSGTGLTSERVRARMVERVRELGVHDARVLAAMQRIERHRFVDPALASRAYEDTALPLGFAQTISQPYIVARCAELALTAAGDPKSARVLEVGTGCGYSAAILSELFGTVFSIERVRALHEMARTHMRPLRIANLRRENSFFKGSRIDCDPVISFSLHVYFCRETGDIEKSKTWSNGKSTSFCWRKSCRCET